MFKSKVLLECHILNATNEIIIYLLRVLFELKFDF